MIPDDAWPKGDRLEYADDDTRTVYDFFYETQRPYTAAENAAADERVAKARAARNEAAMRAYLLSVLSDNRAFMAQAGLISTLTLTNQVKALTKQMIVLERFLLGDFSGTD